MLKKQNNNLVFMRNDNILQNTVPAKPIFEAASIATKPTTTDFKPIVTETTQANTENKSQKKLTDKKAFEKIEEVKEKSDKVVKKIPFLGTPDKPLSASTIDHIPLADIVDDIVLYKDGGAAVLLETSSLNFGLLSEKEQQAVVGAYAALINSLSFSIQIVVRTQRKDISGYLRFFDEKSSKITNPKLAAITADYKRFITESIKKKTVLGKRFYIAIPLSPLELGVAKSAQTVLKRGPLPFAEDYVVKKAKITLYPKRDHIIRQAGRLGLKLKQLTTSDLINLFYEINNPKPPAVKQDIKL